jgi:hypothetical protein
MSTANLVKLIRLKTIVIFLEEQSTGNSGSWYSENDLHEFFDYLQECIKSRDSALIYPILDKWLKIEKLGEAPSPAEAINQILFMTSLQKGYWTLLKMGKL